MKQSVDIFKKNEIGANKKMALGCLIAAGILVLLLIFCGTGILRVTSQTLLLVLFPISIVILCIPFILSKTRCIDRYWFKYLNLILFIVAVFIVNVVLPKHGIIGWAACIVLANHFYNPKVCFVSYVITCVFMAGGIPLGMLFGDWDSALLGIQEAGFTELWGGNPHNFMDRLKFLNEYNYYFPNELNRWAAAYLYYYLGRFVCLTLVFVICYSLSKRTLGLLHAEKEMVDEKGKISTELSVASDIQNATLPNKFPDIDNFESFAFMDAAREVGGDFYDLYQLNNGDVVFTVGDVSGKGVPAALYMMKSKTLLKSLSQNDIPFDQVYFAANNELCENNEHNMFVTAWSMVLSPSTGHVNIINAGHNPPAVKRNGEKFKYIDVPPGFILGGMKDSTYKISESHVQDGDEILIYTDGVTEAQNENGELYGEKRLLELLDSLPPYFSSQEVCKAVNADIKKFAGKAQQSDDITMLYIKYHSNTVYKSLMCKASPQSLGDVTKFVDYNLAKINPTRKEVSQINIVIDEMFSNIIKYAYKGYAEPGEAIVRIMVNKLTRTVTLYFVDSGPKFNPLEHDADVDITKSAEERDIGGLGLFIVKNTMDVISYEYRDNQNVVKIVKKLAELE